MERLERKRVHGHEYYYYSKWEWVAGKCRRVWQKYLGKLEDIAQAVEGGGAAPRYAEVFQWGLPLALWNEARAARLIEEADGLCPKREQGLSAGQYLTVAAVNRAMSPRSKRSMWEWFSQTALVRRLPRASASALASQRFWDHMERIDGDTALAIWRRVVKGVVEREGLDLSSISYDGTNFYTFLDTFNTRCALAQRGKNKQGRGNLRQISYALFCGADGHMPLYYEVYEGSRHDAKQFPLMVERFEQFLGALGGWPGRRADITLIFDKGNNSPENFALLDGLALHYVGSVKLDEHKDLATVSNHDVRFEECAAADLEGTKAFRVTKTVYGRPRTLVTTYNPRLFHTQWLTVQNDLGRAVEKLSTLRQALEDRAHGLLRGGRAPTQASVDHQCDAIRSRPYLKRVLPVQVTLGPDGLPALAFEIDSQALEAIAQTYLGKNILITDREAWNNDQIIQAYRSQFIIENIFKEAKDRAIGTWWPLLHWTESKIKVHALYCTLALLLRALLLRRARQAGLPLSMKRLLGELGAIREVVNIYPRHRRQKAEPTRSVLTRTSDLQDRLMAVLALRKEENENLG